MSDPRTLVAWWPILDEDQTARDLTRQAMADLPRILGLCHAELAGQPTFTVRDGATVAGASAHPTILWCEAPVVTTHRSAA